MLQLTINEKGGPSRTESFEKDEVTIGRVQGNDIILPKGNISKRHSRIVLKDGKLIIVDLKSTNGTYVNGKKIVAPQVIKGSDKVYIGDFTLQVDQEGNGVLAEPAPRGQSIPGAEEEIDLFGGDPAPEAEPSPGLIDQSFDQDFGADPGAEAEPALELDDDFEMDDGGVEPAPLELDSGFEPEPESVEPIIPDPPRVEPSAPSLDLPPPLEDDGLEPDLEETPPPELEPVAEYEDAAPTSMPEPEPEPEAELEPEEELEPAFEEEPEDEALPEVAEIAAPVGSPVVAPMEMVAAPAALMPSAAAMAAPIEPWERDVLLAELELAILDGLGSGLSAGELVAAVPDARTFAAARIGALAAYVPGSVDAAALVELAVTRVTGLGPIAELLEDAEVVELTCGPDLQIWADREVRLEPTGDAFGSETAMVAAVYALAYMGGARPGEVGPLVDARLRDGARVVATLPPASFRGPTLSVRKTTRDFFTLEKLTEYDAVDADISALLAAAVRFRQSILLSVGPGVSPTATLNALLDKVPSDERLLVVEGGVELHLGSHPQTLAFDPRSAPSMQEILQIAAAAQSERLVVAELEADQAYPVLSALAGRYEGALVAVSAPSAAKGLEQVGSWAEASELVGAAFDLVIHESKLPDSSRRITEVAELVDGELVTLFSFEQTGVDDAKLITGRFACSGRVPSFLGPLVDSGIADVDLGVYGEQTPDGTDEV